MIRRATIDDLRELVEGGIMFAEEAGLLDLVEDGVEDAIETLLSMEQVYIYVAETDRIIGGIGFSIMPFLWNMSKTELSELFFWVEPGAPPTVALRLLRRMMKDAEEEKVDTASIFKLPTSPEKVGHVYERLGFHKAQETYTRNFSWP